MTRLPHKKRHNTSQRQSSNLTDPLRVDRLVRALIAYYSDPDGGITAASKLSGCPNRTLRRYLYRLKSGTYAPLKRVLAYNFQWQQFLCTINVDCATSLPIPPALTPPEERPWAEKALVKVPQLAQTRHIVLLGKKTVWPYLNADAANRVAISNRFNNNG